MHGLYAPLRAPRHARLPGKTRAEPGRIQARRLAVPDGVYTGVRAAGGTGVCF